MMQLSDLMNQLGEFSNNYLCSNSRRPYLLTENASPIIESITTEHHGISFINDIKA